MEKITAGQTGAFAHVYLRSFSFFKNFVTMAGGHLPGERELLHVFVIHLIKEAGMVAFL